MAAASPISMETLITIKLSLGNENRRFKLPFKDLGPNTLPSKLRSLLGLPADTEVIFERYSDSAGSFVRLDSENVSVYKQLHRAAKAKLKLRIKATFLDGSETIKSESEETPKAVEHEAHGTFASQLAPAKPEHLSLPDFAKQQMRDLQARLQATQKIQEDQLTSLDKEFSRFDDATSGIMQRLSVIERKPVSPAAENKPADSEEHVHPVPTGCPFAQFSVCCNYCNKDIPGAHWHCSICMEGDYDLCADCVESGQHCYVDHHFLIKRVIENGRVINSTIEKLSPKAMADNKTAPRLPEVEESTENFSKAVSDAYNEPVPEPAAEEPSRTCNSCVNAFEESKFVHCTDCEDYDLCFPCHKGNRHGHHPGHTFIPVGENVYMTANTRALLAPGRDVRHAAICDGCDRSITGIRHKCLACPDWDYCSACVKSSHLIHPGHRFVPIYQPVSGPIGPRSIHFGIRCDGPLCKNRSRQAFITGDRYKCAICHDTDFCANCEALPTNTHNRTHPLIKFRTPVRNCSVTSFNARESGETPVALGDRTQPAQTRSKSTETIPAAQSANAATQVQTVAELKPEITEASKAASPMPIQPSKLKALFVKDTVTDGSEVEAGAVFEQTWTLRNPGPHAWPAGCGLRFTGGDKMLDIDTKNPSSGADLERAVSSNTIDRPVEAGEEVSFAVTLRASERPCSQISYWRLKNPEGIAFGHRLWCEIKVVEPTMRLKEPKIAEPTEVKQEPPQEPLRESQMIFPKLEKESPQSSIHNEIVPESVAPSTIAAEDQDFLDDVENVDIDDSSDDGFFTDEEYEILDNESELSAANNGKA